MKVFLLKIIPESLFLFYIHWKKKLFPRYYFRSYAQEGEDMLLRKIFTQKRFGFFVDIGAHHPQRFSNTYFFYRMGWNGINIDANPGNISLFNSSRTRDINIDAAISDSEEEITFYSFEDSALSGLDAEVSKQRIENENIKLKKIIKIKPRRLEEILDEHLPKHINQIDFMTIDVEGAEMQVLKSNNWKKYKPSYLLLEILNLDLDNVKSNSTYEEVVKLGYHLEAKTFNTCLFKLSNS